MDAATDVRYRRSRIRNSILDYLRSTASHPSAEDVHMAVRSNHPKVSFGTVYRNLNILVDRGEAWRLESSRGRDRFDIAGVFHAHFHCERCGKVYDLPMKPDMLSSAREAAEGAGHRIIGHQVDFMGVCIHCNEAD